MTLDVLIKALTQLRASQKGSGKYPVYVQSVSPEGVTSALGFNVSIGDPADGGLVWIWPTEEHPPAWFEGVEC